MSTHVHFCVGPYMYYVHVHTHAHVIGQKASSDVMSQALPNFHWRQSLGLPWAR